MTDFHERGMVTVEPSAQVDSALEVMKHAGVRSAFVMDETRQRVVGLITAYDIMGEKPLRFLQTMGGNYRSTSRREVQVRDIMEPAEEWMVSRLEDVDGATVEAVLDAFQKARRTHIAVVEGVPGEIPRLRGVFSAAKILRLTRDSRLHSRHESRSVVFDLPLAVTPGPPPAGVA